MTDQELQKIAPYIYTAIGVGSVLLFIGLAIWGLVS